MSSSGKHAWEPEDYDDEPPGFRPVPRKPAHDLPTLADVVPLVRAGSSMTRKTRLDGIADGTLIPVDRGQYLDSVGFGAFSTRWQRLHALRLVQAVVASRRCKGGYLAGWASSWVYGADVRTETSTIHMAVGPARSGKTTELLALKVPSHGSLPAAEVGPMTVAVRLWGIPDEWKTETAGCRHLNVEGTLATCALAMAPEDAFVVGSWTLFLESGGRHAFAEARRQWGSEVIGRVVDQLLATRIRDRFRAAQVVSQMDAVPESVKELELLWILKTAFGVVRVQVTIQCEGNKTRRVDFLLEDAGIAIEFDGKIKFGRTADAAWDKVVEIFGRDRELMAQRIWVIHFTAKDINDPEKVVRIVRECMAARVDWMTRDR